jgi:hypothetical protein
MNDRSIKSDEIQTFNQENILSLFCTKLNNYNPTGE